MERFSVALVAWLMPAIGEGRRKQDGSGSGSNRTGKLKFDILLQLPCKQSSSAECMHSGMLRDIM